MNGAALPVVARNTRDFSSLEDSTVMVLLRALSTRSTASEPEDEPARPDSAALFLLSVFTTSM